MTTYIYETVMGPVEIEVERKWATMLEEEDKGEKHSERRHARPDHKYAPGAPLSLDAADPDGAWICDSADEFGGIEVRIDLIRALETLTELQRYCVIEICLNGRTYRDVAAELSRDHSTIRDVIRAAKVKIKKHL